MKNFRFLEHTADLKFLAIGNTIEECFENSAMAMFSAIVNIDYVKDDVKKNIRISSRELEILLHDFLSELLFIFETESLIFRKFNVKIKMNNENKGYVLNAIAYGERFNNERHEIKTHIKAVTFHDFFIRKENDRWKAQVLCDI